MPTFMQPTVIKGSVSDSLYFQLSDSPVSVSVELHPDVILDVDVSGAVVGIDFQHVAELLAEAHTPDIRSMSTAVLRGEVYSLPEQPHEVVGSGRLVYEVV